MYGLALDGTQRQKGEAAQPEAPTPTFPLHYPPHIWIQCENRAREPGGWLRGGGRCASGDSLGNIKSQGCATAITAPSFRAGVACGVKGGGSVVPLCLCC